MQRTLIHTQSLMSKGPLSCCSARSRTTGRNYVQRSVAPAPATANAWTKRVRHLPAAVICAAAADVEADATTETEQPRAIESNPLNEKSTSAKRKPQKGKRQQSLRKRSSGVLTVGDETRRATAAGYAANWLREHGTMKAVAYAQPDGPSLLKTLALVNSYLNEDDRCMAMVNMSEGEQGNLELDLAVAARQTLDSAEPLRVANTHRVDVNKNIIVARVSNNKPISLLAAGPKAIAIATASLIAAQDRLRELGFHIAVVPSFIRTNRDPPAPTTEADANPTAAAEATTAGEGEASALTGGQGGARSSLKLHVVLVSNPVSDRPPVPGTTRGNALRTQSKARVLSSVDLAGMFSEDEAPESAELSNGPIVLEVTQSVDWMSLGTQISQELRSKGLVRLAVLKSASGACLKAINSAGSFLNDNNSQQDPAPPAAQQLAIICDIATSTRDGTLLLNLTTQTPESTLIPLPPQFTASSIPGTPSASSSPQAPAPSDSSPEQPSAGEAPSSDASTSSNGQRRESEPYGGYLKIGQATDSGNVASAMFRRCEQFEGQCALRLSYGKAAEVALAALVQARDAVQTRRGRDLCFRVAGTTVEVQGNPMQMCCLFVGARPL